MLFITWWRERILWPFRFFLINDFLNKRHLFWTKVENKNLVLCNILVDKSAFFERSEKLRSKFKLSHRFSLKVNNKTSIYDNITILIPYSKQPTVSSVIWHNFFLFSRSGTAYFFVFLILLSDVQINLVSQPRKNRSKSKKVILIEAMASHTVNTILIHNWTKIQDYLHMK